MVMLDVGSYLGVEAAEGMIEVLRDVSDRVIILPHMLYYKFLHIF